MARIKINNGQNYTEKIKYEFYENNKGNLIGEK